MYPRGGVIINISSFIFFSSFNIIILLEDTPSNGQIFIRSYDMIVYPLCGMFSLHLNSTKYDGQNHKDDHDENN